MGTLDPIATQPIILFDGLCNLCSGSVQFVINKDSKDYFRFASLQSSFGQNQLQKFELPANLIYSIILIKNGVAYQKSSAALEIARSLNQPWPAFYFFIIVPRFIRDWVYDIISKNRYVWFGKKDSCMIPKQELKSRFLD